MAVVPLSEVRSRGFGSRSLSALSTTRAALGTVQSVVLVEPSDRQVPHPERETAEEAEDQEDVQQPDPGGADCVEAAHRSGGDRRREHARARFLPDAPPILSDDRDRHVLECIRTMRMTCGTVAERLGLG